MYFETQEIAEQFRIEIEDAIEEIKQFAGHYAGQKHYDLITKSKATKISRAIDELVYSNNALNGFFLMPDEISTKKLTDYLHRTLEIDCDSSITRYYVAKLLQKRANEVYRNIKKGTISLALNNGDLKRQREQRQKEYKKRENMGLKLIRVHK